MVIRGSFGNFQSRRENSSFNDEYLGFFHNNSSASITIDLNFKISNNFPSLPTRGWLKIARPLESILIRTGIKTHNGKNKIAKTEANTKSINRLPTSYIIINIR